MPQFRPVIRRRESGGSVWLDVTDRVVAIHWELGRARLPAPGQLPPHSAGSLTLDADRGTFSRGDSVEAAWMWDEGPPPDPPPALVRTGHWFAPPSRVWDSFRPSSDSEFQGRRSGSLLPWYASIRRSGGAGNPSLDHYTGRLAFSGIVDQVVPEFARGGERVWCDDAMGLASARRLFYWPQVDAVEDDFLGRNLHWEEDLFYFVHGMAPARTVLDLPFGRLTKPTNRVLLDLGGNTLDYLMDALRSGYGAAVCMVGHQWVVDTPGLRSPGDDRFPETYRYGRLELPAGAVRQVEVRDYVYEPSFEWRWPALRFPDFVGVQPSQRVVARYYDLRLVETTITQDAPVAYVDLDLNNVVIGKHSDLEITNVARRSDPIDLGATIAVTVERPVDSGVSGSTWRCKIAGSGFTVSQWEAGVNSFDLSFKADAVFGNAPVTGYRVVGTDLVLGHQLGSAIDGRIVDVDGRQDPGRMAVKYGRRRRYCRFNLDPNGGVDYLLPPRGFMSRFEVREETLTLGPVSWTYPTTMMRLALDDPFAASDALGARDWAVEGVALDVGRTNSGWQGRYEIYASEDVDG